MGTTLSRVALFAGLAVGIGACRAFVPCGWGDRIAMGQTYRVDIVELYSSTSTTAAFRSELDVMFVGDPLETCGTLDEVTAGVAFDLRTIPASVPSELSCSYWRAQIDSPDITIGTPLPIFLADLGTNMMYAGGVRDLGAGCVGSWEFALHAPRVDPFTPPTPSEVPSVLAYRVFVAEEGAVDACATLSGVPATPSGFRCGDAFVGAMRLAP